MSSPCCYSDLSPELHEVTLVLFSDECLDGHEQRCEPIPVVLLIEVATEIIAISRTGAMKNTTWTNLQ